MQIQAQQQEQQRTQQTVQERAAVIDAWAASKFFPAGLLMTDSNINQLKYALDKIPVLSISSIVEAVQRLGDLRTGGVLEYFREPEKVIEYREKEKSPEQIQKEKAAAKLLLGIDSYSFQPDRAEQARKSQANVNARQQAANDRANAKSKREVTAEIERYSCQHSSGRKDHAETDRRRAQLRQLLPKNDKGDFTAALEKVKAQIKQYPN